MKNEGAGKGGSQYPTLKVIRQRIGELSGEVSALTPERVEKVRRSAGVDGLDPLVCFQNGGLGGRFYGLVSDIDPDLAPATIVRLCSILTSQVLIPLGRLEQRLGGGDVTRLWSERVAELKFPGGDGEKECNAFVESVAGRVEAGQVALASG